MHIASGIDIERNDLAARMVDDDKVLVRGILTMIFRQKDK